MPKRSNEDKIRHLHNKLRKLEKKKENSRRIRRPVIFSASSDSEPEQTEYIGVEVDEAPADDTAADLEPTDDAASPHSEAGGTTDTADPQTADSAPIPTVDDDTLDAPLDPEILKALGANTEDDPEYGPKIHDNLSRLWLPLLKKGLPKTEKEQLSKKYPVPENCKLLMAPRLNLEISAAMTESARGRDKKLVATQQQLGIGITAVNRALDTLLAKEENHVVNGIKYLSDACRLLCDLHHMDSQTRMKLITPNLDRSFLNIVQDTHRDDTLFGSKLSEKIKSSKAIEKQGLQIKKTIPTAAAPTASTSRSSQNRGNWPAPPRYQPNRGGRGASRKQPQSRKPAQATNQSARPPQGRTAGRAPPQQ